MVQTRTQTVRMALAAYPHHSALRRQTMARAGEGVRGEVHGQVPGAPPPQAAGTLYFAMDVDEVPAAGGSRPDRLAPVSGPQERVQQHFVEQLVELVRGVPVLDAPEPSPVKWTLAGSPGPELPSGGEGDDCVLPGGTNSSRPPRPLPRFRTTQLRGDRRWQGPRRLWI